VIFVKETISIRFDTLIEEGKRLEESIRGSLLRGPSDMLDNSRVTEYQAFISSSANLIKSISRPASPYYEQIDSILQHEHLAWGVPIVVFQKVLGLLISAKQEWDYGLIRQIEYIFVAETFDDFLDHADSYHKGNKKIEAAVLASAVLEDTIKRIARKNGVEPRSLLLEQLIDELVKADVFTPVKAKRVQSFSGIRNSVLRAEWDDFDIRDVGQLIDETRELIMEFL